MNARPEPRDMNVDELIVHYEPVIVEAQFNHAIRRLREVFEETVKNDVQGGRRLTELVHLLAGNRRKVCLEVQVERRVDS